MKRPIQPDKPRKLDKPENRTRETYTIYCYDDEKSLYDILNVIIEKNNGDLPETRDIMIGFGPLYEHDDPNIEFSWYKDLPPSRRYDMAIKKYEAALRDYESELVEYEEKMKEYRKLEKEYQIWFYEEQLSKLKGKR